MCDFDVTIRDDLIECCCVVSRIRACSLESGSRDFSIAADEFNTSYVGHWWPVMFIVNETSRLNGKFIFAIRGGGNCSYENGNKFVSTF